MQTIAAQSHSLLGWESRKTLDFKKSICEGRCCDATSTLMGPESAWCYSSPESIWSISLHWSWQRNRKVSKFKEPCKNRRSHTNRWMGDEIIGTVWNYFYLAENKSWHMWLSDIDTTSICWLDFFLRAVLNTPLFCCIIIGVCGL